MSESTNLPARPRGHLIRSHSNFAARTATDEQHQLDRRWSLFSPRDETPESAAAWEPVQTGGGPAGTSNGSLPTAASGFVAWWNGFSQYSPQQLRPRFRSKSRDSKHALASGKTRSRSRARAVKGIGHGKLGTFAGVFVPTTLNVLSILMFLRFGFILGQSGVLGMMAMLIACYAINLLTTMSVSAIATNGQVRGGGAYFLISRTLGPEFGGSIGIVFYLGCVLNTGMNAVGLIDCLRYNFGASAGSWSRWLPDSFWFSYLWATMVLVVCTAICLAGSSLFAKASNGLLAILLVATFSIPLSALVQSPFNSKRLGIHYTGLSWQTFRNNILPSFTRGADGSQLRGRETWQDLFGILFPATGGIFAYVQLQPSLPQRLLKSIDQWGQHVWRLETPEQGHSKRHPLRPGAHICDLHVGNPCFSGDRNTE
jgi:solute carrier family 12 (potassium/chloride transporters), member 9